MWLTSFYSLLPGDCCKSNMSSVGHT